MKGQIRTEVHAQRINIWGHREREAIDKSDRMASEDTLPMP